MKCEFDSTKTIETIQTIGVLVLFFLSVVLTCINETFGILLAIPLMIIGIVLMGILPEILCRQINLSDEKLDVSYKFFSESVPLNDIAKAECVIKSEGQRFGGVIYTLVLYIKCKSGKEYKFIKKLYDVEKDYPVQHADKFKRYVDEQPMMKMCNMINDRL